MPEGWGGRHLALRLLPVSLCLHGGLQEEAGSDSVCEAPGVLGIVFLQGSSEIFSLQSFAVKLTAAGERIDSIFLALK